MNYSSSYIGSRAGLNSVESQYSSQRFTRGISPMKHVTISMTRDKNRHCIPYTSAAFTPMKGEGVTTLIPNAYGYRVECPRIPDGEGSQAWKYGCVSTGANPIPQWTQGWNNGQYCRTFFGH